MLVLFLRCRDYKFTLLQKFERTRLPRFYIISPHLTHRLATGTPMSLIGLAVRVIEHWG